jgi:hypothetical protein
MRTFSAQMTVPSRNATRAGSYPAQTRALSLRVEDVAILACYVHVMSEERGQWRDGDIDNINRVQHSSYYKHHLL